MAPACPANNLHVESFIWRVCAKEANQWIIAVCSGHSCLNCMLRCACISEGAVGGTGDERIGNAAHEGGLQGGTRAPGKTWGTAHVVGLAQTPEVADAHSATGSLSGLWWGQRRRKRL